MTTDSIPIIFMAIGFLGLNNRGRSRNQFQVRYIAFSEVILLGEKKLLLEDVYDYTGELDECGHACGFGVAVNTNKNHDWINGTWLEDKEHGFSR